MQNLLSKYIMNNTVPQKINEATSKKRKISHIKLASKETPKMELLQCKKFISNVLYQNCLGKKTKPE